MPPDAPPDDRYFALEEIPRGDGPTLWSKLGVRGYPDPPPGCEILALATPEAAERAVATDGVVVDASATAGAAWRGADPASLPRLSIEEPSAAALRCARRALPAAEARAALPWDAHPPAAALLLAPPGDRGTARVEAEIDAAARRLAPAGVAWILLHKDRGAKRYAKGVARRFERSEIVERSRGWRLLRAQGPLPDDDTLSADTAAAGTPPADVEPWIEAEVDLPTGRTRLDALPGVHAAGRLDPGTAELLAQVTPGDLEGRAVLDLGCGSGALACVAAASGAARVLALDDDLAAVRSAERNLGRSKAAATASQVLHSDLDFAVGTAHDGFDVVLCNPPFHVGRAVRLDLPRAFVRAAARRLAPGGTLWLVANAQLPYEAAFDAWNDLEVRPAGRFKVLRATR